MLARNPQTLRDLLGTQKITHVKTPFLLGVIFRLCGMIMIHNFRTCNDLLCVRKQPPGEDVTTVEIKARVQAASGLTCLNDAVWKAVETKYGLAITRLQSGQLDDEEHKEWFMVLGNAARETAKTLLQKARAAYGLPEERNDEDADTGPSVREADRTPSSIGNGLNVTLEKDFLFPPEEQHRARLIARVF